jgi:serine/threonine protein kinase
MKVCPRCSELHPDDVSLCPKDGTRLKRVLDPLIGKTVGGRFRLIQRLGSGGMSSVYLARHVLIDRLMAIKTLRRELSRDPIQRDRFLREARAVNRINHENIVEITDFGETEDGLVYLVMEYVPGEPLLTVMGEGPFPALRALHIAEQCGHALGRAHQMGVIHRDLKPENILLVQRKSRPDFVKLLDFGIAKILDAPSLTGSQQIFGTPGYIAPEYIQSADIDGRSDLYSLGCILYEMVTGALPFDYEYPGDLLVKHVTEPPVPPRVRHPPVEQVMEDFILRCLAKDPAERFRDAFHFNAELKKVRELLGSSDAEWGDLNQSLPPPPAPRDARDTQLEDERVTWVADPGASKAPVPGAPRSDATLLEAEAASRLRAAAPPEKDANEPVLADLGPLEEILIEVDLDDDEGSPAIPWPPPVAETVEPAKLALPEPPSSAAPAPRPSARLHRGGLLGARRWRARFTAIRSYLDEIEMRSPAPPDVAQAMALASRTLDALETEAQEAQREQEEAEALHRKARDFRATLGRAMDQVAGRLSAERGVFEQLIARRTTLRASREAVRVKVREGSATEGEADALLWELAAVEEELRQKGLGCDELESHLAELAAELDLHNEAVEREQERLARILDDRMLRLERSAAELRSPLERAEAHVRARWTDDVTPSAGTPIPG